MTTSLSALARRAKHGYQSTKSGRTNWLAGTFEMAGALTSARKKLPSDQAFNAWMKKAGLASISKDDRAALITIGENVKAARTYFRENDSWSWRMCSQRIRPWGAVSQAAKPASQPTTRYVTARVTEHKQQLSVPYYTTTGPDRPLVAQSHFSGRSDGSHLRVISDPPAPEPHLLQPYDRDRDAVDAIEAIVAAASHDTRSIASHWLDRSDLPTSDQIRESSWLAGNAR